MKKDYFKKVDRKVLALIRDIRREADKNNCEAYLVGGIVRDMLLKRKNLDLDVVVVGSATSLAKKWATKKKARCLVHQRFSTATVTFKNGMHVDFATARKEHYPHAGALPVVKKGTLRDDLFRRDFTINTLAINISSDQFGQLVDEFDGQADLEKGRIRILHDQSFVDDPTRILRAVRFAQRFNFTIDRSTLQLLKCALKNNLPSRVKPERYFAEFIKLLSEANPEKSIVQLHRIGGLKFLGCNGKVNVRLAKTITAHMKSLSQRGINQEDSERWLIYFMALLDNESVSSAGRIVRQFNLRRSDRHSVLMSKNAEKTINHLKKKDVLPSEIYQLLRPLSYETILYMRVKTSLKVVHRRIDNFLTKYKDVKLNINGHDLRRIGLVSGQRMGRILRHLLYQKLNGQLKNRSAQFKEAKKYTCR